MSKIKGRFAKNYDDFIKRDSLLPDGLLNLIKSKKADNILEFGCGTGSVAVGLSLEGYCVTGVDLSADMLGKARSKSKKFNSKTQFITGDITRINLNREYDLLLCLGNTFPLIHKLPDARRLTANFARHLNPGGTLIIQQLNYDRILQDKPRTFAVDRSENSIRIKQYKYGKSLIEFVVSILDLSTIPPRAHTSVSKIRPWKKVELFAELNNAGFNKIRALGDYHSSKFGPKSKDLIIVASLKK